MKRIGVGLIGVLLVAGCATAGSLDDTRAKALDRVRSELFDHSFAQVYEAAVQACLDLDLTISREIPEEGKIYARTSPNMAKVVVYKTGFGETVGLYLTRLEDQKTKVEVVTQKTNRLEMGFRDYRKILLTLIRLRLEAARPQGAQGS